MRGNTINLPLAEGRVTRGSEPLWQWDYGQWLTFQSAALPAAFEVHFGKAGSFEDEGSLCRIGRRSGVLIPDECLTWGCDIHVWIYAHQASKDGETVYHGVLPVMKRARPEEVAMDAEQVTAFGQAILAVNEATEISDRAVSAVEEANRSAAMYAEMLGQQAASAGYMAVDVSDDTGHLLYTRTDNVNIELALDNAGHLVMPMA